MVWRPERHQSESETFPVNIWLTFIWFLTLSVRCTQSETKRVELLQLAIPSYVLPIAFASSTRPFGEACALFIDAFLSVHMLTLVMLLFPDLFRLL